ncbi:MAG: hypothetical protein DHS20C02_10000 [Micavibrio sp.]|nr:MAG: hypothetical protein DHS20C02_10000 [Micavibrio sp.]
MQIKRAPVILGLTVLLGLSACQSEPKRDIDNSQYWQRVSASSATWLRGPKAQQVLNRDISRCVTELRELEKLGSLKGAIPADPHGRILDPDYETRADGWDEPERMGAMFAEHSDYHDFETCMLAKGWERTKYVPYDVSEEAKMNYLRHHVATRDEYDTSGKIKKKKEKPRGDFDNLNE